MRRRIVRSHLGSSWIDFEQVRSHIDCRFLPHGFYSLIPTALCSMAFWTTIVQDGCDYAKLEGDSVETITGSDIIPFLEAGISHYRAPIFYPSESEWKMVFTSDCQDYPSGDLDTVANLSKFMTIIGATIGGALTLFLCFTTCLSFSIRTWRSCAVTALLAAFLRSGSFLFLLSSICTSGQSHCVVAFGSRMDIIGVTLWVASSISMFGHYPDPKLRQITDEELIHSVAEAESLAPKRLSVASQARRTSRSSQLAGGESNRWSSLSSKVHGADQQSMPSRSYFSYDGGQSDESQSHYPSKDRGSFA